MSSTVGKSGQVIHSQSREIIFNVFKYFRGKEPTKSSKELNGMVSEAVCVSAQTVEKIIIEGKHLQFIIRCIK